MPWGLWAQSADFENARTGTGNQEQRTATAMAIGGGRLMYAGNHASKYAALSAAALSVAPSDILKTRVLMTVVGGQIVYQAN